MESHVKVLAWLQIAYSLMGLFGVLALFVIGGSMGIFLNWMVPDVLIPAGIIAVVTSLIGVFILVTSLPGLIAGIGLLTYRPWARIVTMILCVLHLFHVPFGTLLGAYGLWVLLQSDTDRLFSRDATVPAGGNWSPR